MILYGYNGHEYGFYTKEDKGILTKYVEIEEDYKNEIIREANEKDKIIEPDEQGFPILKERYPLSPEENAHYELIEKKMFLSSTDYIVIKIAEGSATPEEYAEILRQRKDARYRINELQKKLESIGENTIPIPS